MVRQGVFDGLCLRSLSRAHDQQPVEPGSLRRENVEGAAVLALEIGRRRRPLISAYRRAENFAGFRREREIVSGEGDKHGGSPLRRGLRRLGHRIERDKLDRDRRGHP